MNENEIQRVYASIVAIPLCGASRSQVKRTLDAVLDIPVDAILDDYSVIIGGKEWRVQMPTDTLAEDTLRDEIEEDLVNRLGSDIEMGEMLEPGVWRVFVGPERCMIRAWVIYFHWVRLVYWAIKESEWHGDVPDALVEASYAAERASRSI